MAVPWAELVRRVPPKVEVGECHCNIILLFIQGAPQDCLPLRSLLLMHWQTHEWAGRQGCSGIGREQINFFRVKRSPK